MGHNIVHRDYPLNCDKKKVQQEWDITVQHEDYGEGASGLGTQIRWLDVTLESYEEAEEYIRAHDKGWYDCLAVKYRDFSKVQPSKRVKELEERLRAATEAYTAKDSKVSFAEAKSITIGCKRCQSKLARSFLRSNLCPVCKADLRPESTLKAIASAKASMEKARAALEEERKKYHLRSQKQAEVRWLVKVEYHT